MLINFSFSICYFSFGICSFPFPICSFPLRYVPYHFRYVSFPLRYVLVVWCRRYSKKKLGCGIDKYAFLPVVRYIHVRFTARHSADGGSLPRNSMYSDTDIGEVLRRIGNLQWGITIIHNPLGSIPASTDTVESEGRQMKQCWRKYLKIQTKIIYTKNHPKSSKCIQHLKTKVYQWWFKVQFLKTGSMQILRLQEDFFVKCLWWPY